MPRFSLKIFLLGVIAVAGICFGGNTLEARVVIPNGTGSTGAVTDRFEYDVYGMTTYRTGTVDTPYKYVGQFGVETDAHGTMYMRARYYNPNLMRFVNADPIGFAGGMNWYAYAGNSPLMYMDAAGLCPSSCWSDDGSWQRQGGSLAVGLIPWVGTGQSVVELISGQDYISGEEANRVMAGIGIFAGLVPAGKTVVKGEGKLIAKYGDEAVDLAKTGWKKVFGKTVKNELSAVDNLAKPLGLGSTGRTLANNLQEQLAMKQVMSNPEAGALIDLKKGMTDARWPASDGWVKMHQNVNGIEVHYLKNTKTGAVDDFKVKD